MNLDRRQFFRSLAVGAFATSESGSLFRALAKLGAGTLAPIQAAERDPVTHLITRITFGVTPGLYTYVQAIGVDAFLEQQLAPEALDDSAVTPHLEPFSSIIWQNGGILTREYVGMPQVVSTALIGTWLMRALYSQRQLYERMVHFFSDHFSLFGAKTPVLFLKVDDDRSVIRPHALGRFRDILGASAHSPAMLFYLDNVRSRQTGPNENYARELLELHTMGVNGGYTENDVKEVARCFTGWSVSFLQETPAGAVFFRFRDYYHDNRRKSVLGMNLPRRGGQQDGEIVLDLLARHPATARHISTKLARRFVSDNPPESLIDACAEVFLQSDGDIPSLLRVIFASDEFWNAPPKFKQPFEYILSLFRAMAYEVERPRQVMNSLYSPLEKMGHVPFTWPTPDGFPDVQAAWTDNLLPRWNTAIAAASGDLPGARANADALVALLDANGVPLEVEPVILFMGNYLFGRSLTTQERDVLVRFANSTEGNSAERIGAGLALMLASPAFQYR
jgi:hypothetical protein